MIEPMTRKTIEIYVQTSLCSHQSKFYLAMKVI